MLGLLQSNVFSSVLSRKSDKKIIFWGKIVVFAALLTYIVHVIQQQPFDWATVQTQLRAVRYPERWAVSLLLLTPVNWGLEALKWQILLRRVESVRFREACKGVLAGVSLGFAMPAQLGDTTGRVLSLRTNRTRAVGASLVSGGMQFYVSIVFGTMADVHIVGVNSLAAGHLTLVPERNQTAGSWLLALLVGLSVGGVGFGLFRKRVVDYLSGRSALRRFAGYWQVAGLYSDREIGLALGAASLRYLVFSLQFYLAMRVVGLTLPPIVAASGIGLVFLAKTITPAFNLLSDLGVREAASLWVFSPFAVSIPVLLTATLTLWVANVLMPVLVGLIWVWKLKITAQ